MVDRAVTADAVLKAIRAADKTLITAAEIFDVYTGAGVEDGRKSVAVEVTLQPRDSSLTDADIESASRSVIKAVQDATGGVLRG